MTTWLNPGRWLLVGGLIAALMAGYGAWSSHQQVIGYERANSEFRAQSVRTDLQRASLAQPAAAAHAAAQVHIRTVTKTILEKVPVYVQADACALPGGFRLLHDAAAHGVIPDAAGLADAGTVPAQDVATTVVENYGIARANSAQLVEIQAWIAAQGALK